MCDGSGIGARSAETAHFLRWRTGESQFQFHGVDGLKPAVDSAVDAGDDTIDVAEERSRVGVPADSSAIVMRKNDPQTKAGRALTPFIESGC